VIVQNKLIDDTKKYIKQRQCKSRFIQDQGSHSALKDKEAAGYLDLPVTGDKESTVEDNYSDSEAGEVVEGLEEWWNHYKRYPI